MSNKRKISKFDHSTMRKALLRVVEDNCSIRGAAKEFMLPYALLRQYVTKYNATNDKNRESICFSPNYKVNLIFSEELENKLVQYLIIARRLHYSLTGDDVRRLSYDLAVKHKLRIPLNWKKSNKAGIHWMRGFLKRHPQINNILSLSKRFRQTETSNFHSKKENVNDKIKFRPIETSDLHSEEENVNEKNELIIEEENLEDFIKSDEEEIDLISKPVIIIPVKKEK